MINLRNISLRLGQREIFDNTELFIYENHKVGITGANGCGKSTLFALLQSKILPDSGTVSIPGNWKIAHLEQETPALNTSILDFVLDGDKQLRRIENQLQLAEQANDGNLIAKLHQDYADIDGYTAIARAGILLHGLGFKNEEFDSSVKSFSGGWRMRLNLAQTLMSRAEILLLDEPTNHLDLDAMIWLESWLKKLSCTLLLISHDRDFLDAIVSNIVHIEHKKIFTYTGNYSSFEIQRATKLELQQAMHEKQARQRQHLQSYVDRFRYKASKARQAQSRIKMLERMENITAAHVDSPFEFHFPKPIKCPDPLIVLEHLNAGYNETVILNNINLTIRPEMRLGLLGANGAGKSTLIKTLANELTPMKGDIVQSKDVVIGYFAQHQVDHLSLDKSPLQHLQALKTNSTEQAIRNFLGGFNFHADMALEPITNFSGGEKARLALAKIIWQRPNILLLDEPTNHLDLDMRHALTLALQEYEGALIVISHDRHLLRTACDEFYLVHDSKVDPFDGTMDDYAKWLLKSVGQKNSKTKPQKKPDKKPLTTEKRTAMQQLKKQLKQVEHKIQQLTQRQKSIEESLSHQEIYDAKHSAELQKHLKDQAELDNELQALEQQWLELTSQIEKQ